MPYNMSSLAANSTGMLELTQNVNSHLMQGWLGILFLMGLVVVIFMGMMVATQDTKRSVAGTSFIAFVLAVMMRAIDILPNIALFITLVAAGAAIAFTWRD